MAGLPSVFVNAKWIFRVSGSYRTPLLGINLAGFYDSRSGYPFIANIQTPIRPNGAGIAYVYLDKLGDNRLDTLRTLDLRVDRPITIGRFTIVPAMDVFNLLNASTPLSIQPVQNAPNANQVSFLDDVSQNLDTEAPFTWELQASRGLHTLTVKATNVHNASSLDIEDFYVIL